MNLLTISVLDKGGDSELSLHSNWVYDVKIQWNKGNKCRKKRHFAREKVAEM